MHADDRASAPPMAPPTGASPLAAITTSLPLLLSGLLHLLALQAVVWLGLQFRPDPDPKPPSEVEFSVALAPEPELEALPEPEPDVEPEPTPPPPEPARPRVPPTTPEVEPPAPDEPPPALEETPVAFDNIVLSNEGGNASWTTAQGSGEERDGPIGTTGTVTGRNRSGVAGGVPDGEGRPAPGPRVVGSADLSRAPEPLGNLGALLQRFYPEEAREQGREGTVNARIRVLPNGRVRVLSVQRSSGSEFTAACRRFLQRAARFSPPLDRQGSPVATDAPFFCEFSVRY